jgi:hypothetical protein
MSEETFQHRFTEKKPLFHKKMAIYRFAISNRIIGKRLLESRYYIVLADYPRENPHFLRVFVEKGTWRMKFMSRYRYGWICLCSFTVFWVEVKLRKLLGGKI